MKYLCRKKWKTSTGIIAVSLGFHYLLIFLAYCMIGNGFSLSGLWQLILDRLTQPGDAIRYLDLAENGYVKTGENAINLVFYPLYPLMVRLIGLLIGNFSIAGMIISQVSFAGAAILLYERLLLDGDERSAWYGILLFSLYPFSMFVLGVFSEGLFLLLTISCLYALRKRRFIVAGILGFGAALTRTQGMLLIFPAVYECISLRLGKEKRKIRPGDLAILLIPAGFGVYLVINYILHGNCLKFLEFEAGEPWYQTTKWIGENIAQHYQMAQEYQPLSFIIYYVQIALYFIALGILLWGFMKKAPMGDLLYGGAYLGFTYLSGWMISGGRYLLGCIPLFMLLSKIRQEWIRRMILLLSGMLFFAYGLFYMMGYAIM